MVRVSILQVDIISNALLQHRSAVMCRIMSILFTVVNEKPVLKADATKYIIVFRSQVSNLLNKLQSYLGILI